MARLQLLALAAMTVMTVKPSAAFIVPLNHNSPKKVRSLSMPSSSVVVAQPSLGAVAPLNLQVDPADMSLFTGLDSTNILITSAIYGAAVLASIYRSNSTKADTIKDNDDIVLNPDTISNFDQKKSNYTVTIDSSAATEEEKVVVAPSSVYDRQPTVNYGTKMTGGNNIASVKKSVASTADGEREKSDRLKAAEDKASSVKERTKEKASSIQESAKEKASSFKESAREKTENAKDRIEEKVEANTKDTDKVHGRKRRIALKTVKKILMPWRKWSEL